MTTSRYIKGLQLRTLVLFACLVMVLGSCQDTITDTEQDAIVDPNTYVYLVQLNDRPELRSLTIVDSLNGGGTMTVPDIPAHTSNKFDLVIDRVDDSRANISASQDPQNPVITVRGAGFFTVDSVYVELTIDGFLNRDILTGYR